MWLCRLSLVCCIFRLSSPSVGRVSKIFPHLTSHLFASFFLLSCRLAQNLVAISSSLRRRCPYLWRAAAAQTAIESQIGYARSFNRSTKTCYIMSYKTTLLLFHFFFLNVCFVTFEKVKKKNLIFLSRYPSAENEHFPINWSDRDNRISSLMMVTLRPWNSVFLFLLFHMDGFYLGAGLKFGKNHPTHHRAGYSWPQSIHSIWFLTKAWSRKWESHPAWNDIVIRFSHAFIGCRKSKRSDYICHSLTYKISGEFIFLQNAPRFKCSVLWKKFNNFLFVTIIHPGEWESDTLFEYTLSNIGKICLLAK